MYSKHYYWGLRLLDEHKDICYQTSISLFQPAIDISDNSSRYGQWNQMTRTISISKKLIETQPWSVVHEVLKHEMAHQYVSEHFGGQDNSPHGENYKYACRILGVHPVFVKASGNISINTDMLQGEVSSHAKQMLQKIEKLMALGHSDNLNEAQNASRKANYLLHKYKLEGVKEEYNYYTTYKVICHKKKQIEIVQKKIANILCDYYYVDTVLAPVFDQNDLKEYKAIYLFGKPEDLKIAEHVYYFLYRTAIHMWGNYRKKTKDRKKTSFMVGFAKGVSHNHKRMFSEISEGRDSDENLPMQSVNLLMQKAHEKNSVEMKRVFPRLCSSKQKVNIGSKKAYHRGYEEGLNTHIRKPLEDRGNNTTEPIGLPKFTTK